MGLGIEHEAQRDMEDNKLQSLVEQCNASDGVERKGGSENLSGDPF